MNETIKRSEMVDPKDDLLACPYCGDNYDRRRGCCGESIMHGVLIDADTRKEIVEDSKQ